MDAGIVSIQVFNFLHIMHPGPAGLKTPKVKHQIRSREEETAYTSK